MGKPTKLKIKWDGSVRGIDRGRLSLAEFGPSLGHLLAALRRIASAKIADALDDSAYGSRGGKYAKKAEGLDLELTAVREGSTDLEFECTIEAPQLDLYEELPREAVGAFLDAMESERVAVPKNAAVRKFLESLPQGLSHQRYSLWENGTELRHIEFAAFEIAVTQELPHLVEYRDAEVVGVGFEPGRGEVRLKTPAQVTLAATNAQVDQALGLRGVPVHAMTVNKRLLWIRPMGVPLALPSTEDQAALLGQRWAGLLERLAQ